MVEQKFLAQDGVDGLGKRRALARTELAVVTEKTRNDLVGGMIELEDEADEIGGGLQKGFGMHAPIVSAAAPRQWMRRKRTLRFASLASARPPTQPPASHSITAITDDDLPPLIETPPGLYRHYKGGQYEVVGTVRHSETLEPMTLYRALYGQRGLWVRPAAMFGETVEIDGVVRPRFVKIV